VLVATELLANRLDYPLETRWGQLSNTPNDEPFVEGEDFVGPHDAVLRQSAQFEILCFQPHGGTIARL